MVLCRQRVRLGLHAGQCSWTVPIRARLDGTAHTGHALIAFKLRSVPGDSQQRGKVPAGRVAPSTEPRRGQTKLFGVVTKPAHGGLHVVQLRGEDRLPAETILNTGNSNAGVEQTIADESCRDRRRVGLVAPTKPRSTMNPHDHRDRPAAGRHHQIEQERAEAVQMRNDSVPVDQPIAAYLDRRRALEAARFRTRFSGPASSRNFCVLSSQRVQIAAAPPTNSANTLNLVRRSRVAVGHPASRSL